MNRTQSIFCLALLASLSLKSADFGLVDKANYFNSEEASAINRSCKAFEQNHAITLFIYTYNSEDTNPSFPRSTPNFNKFVFVKIDIRTNQVRTSVLNLTAQSAGIVDRFFLQWGQQNIAEKGIYNSLQMAVNKYSHYLERKKEVARALKAQRENEKKLLPLTSSTIPILIVIIIWFIISFTNRSLKPGDKFENSEFYGLSRLGFSGAFILAIAIIVSTYLLFGKDWLVMMFFLGFAMYPLLVIFGYFVFILLDLFRLSQYESEKIILSTGQKALLINPAISTVDILEINFYETLAEGFYSLNITRYDYHRTTRYDYLVNDSSNTNSSLTVDLKPFKLKSAIRNKPIAGYLKQVHRRIGGFKKYRKESVMTPLMRMGLITRVDWLFNNVRLTAKGIKVKAEILKRMDAQKNLVEMACENVELKEHTFKEINRCFLLVSDFKYQVTRLFNKMYSSQELHLINEHPLAFMFNENYDFDVFRQKHFQAYSFSINWGSFRNLEEAF